METHEKIPEFILLWPPGPAPKVMSRSVGFFFSRVGCRRPALGWWVKTASEVTSARGPGQKRQSRSLVFISRWGRPAGEGERRGR